MWSTPISRSELDLKAFMSPAFRGKRAVAMRETWFDLWFGKTPGSEMGTTHDG